MREHRGFQLVEAVCCHPPERAGEVMVSVRDDLAGIVGDFRCEAEATHWIDGWCYMADLMLEVIMRR